MNIKKFYIGEFVFLLFCIIFIGFIAIKGTTSILETLDWIQESNKTTKNIEDINSSLKEIETNSKAYILTGNDEFLKSYKHAAEEMNIRLNELKSLIQDKEKHEENLSTLQQTVDERLFYLKNEVDLKSSEKMDNDEFQAFINESSAKDTIKSVIEKMLNAENVILDKVKRNERFNTAITISAIVFGLILTLVFGINFIRTMKKINKITVADRINSVPLITENLKFEEILHKN